MRPIKVIPARAVLLAGVAIAPQPAWAQTPPPAGAAAVIEAAKQATGGAAWDRLTTTHDQGRVTMGGLSGTYSDDMDWVHLRQAGAFALGPATGKQGFDGKTAWSVDPSGQVRVEAGAEALAAAVEQAYLGTFAMYFPGRYPAKIEDAGTRKADDGTFQVLKVTPLHADPVELWFDASTHLPARVVELVGQQPHTIYLSNWHDVAGVKMPFHSITRVGNDPKYDQVTDMAAMQSVAVPDSAFAPPPPPAYDARFPAGKTSVTVPIRLLNNHIYLPVSINGKPPVPFMFDTGATNFMDSAHAKMLGVATQGAMAGGGFGNQIAAVGLTKVDTVAVGGLTLQHQIFATSDLSSFTKVEGVDGSGLIGYEFAKRAVLTIDYAKRTMTFTKPDAFRPPAGVVAVPFTFDAHIPMVQASLDGVTGAFEIDTGARSALTVMHPFARANGLIEKYHATKLATTGFGVGGPSKALLGRGEALTIGDVSVKQPVLDMVIDEHGAGAATHTAGNIGGDILKRFTFTLDYGHQLLYFQPNALAAQPDVFDRSGVWVNRGDDGMIVIADVTPQSAASAAGLKAGDKIMAVNGRDARVVEIYELRETFKKKPGTVVKLRVAGADNKTRQVALTLADQV